MTDTGDTTTFGFRTIPRGEKAARVRDVFDSVASRYDLMNDLMSGGVHRIWKSAMIARVNPQPGQSLIDMAGGTGDIAEKFLALADERAARQVTSRATSKAQSSDHAPTNTQSQPHGATPATAVICDINHEMLKAGALRPQEDALNGRLRRVCTDAENLPFPDRSADTYTIAFGIRNVTNIDKALSEAHRVLKPGGRFVCLEFSHPITEGLQKIYDAYSFNVIPWLGEMVANERESYLYLVESIRKFPAQGAFAAMVEKAGFRRVVYENLTGGVAALHMGWRI